MHYLLKRYLIASGLIYLMLITTGLVVLDFVDTSISRQDPLAYSEEKVMLIQQLDTKQLNIFKNDRDHLKLFLFSIISVPLNVIGVLFSTIMSPVRTLYRDGVDIYLPLILLMIMLATYLVLPVYWIILNAKRYRRYNKSGLINRLYVKVFYITFSSVIFILGSYLTSTFWVLLFFKHFRGFF